MFVREDYTLSQRINVVGDLEFRTQRYIFKQYMEGNYSGDQLNWFSVDNVFLNPKLGVQFSVSEELAGYFTLGRSQRAPVNDEYWDIWEGPDDLGVDPLFATSDTIRNNGRVARIEWSDPLIEPEKVLNMELGTRWASGALSLKVNGYWMDFRNEIVPAGGVRDGSPVSDNAERSVHRGLEVETSYRPSRGFSGYANLSFSDDRLVDYVINEAVYDDNWNLVGMNEVDLGGNRIALFPALMASMGVGYTYGDLRFGINAQNLGKQYLDNTQNEERTIDPFTLVNLRTSIRFDRLFPETALTLDLQVNNLFDEEYETSGYYYGENYYYVGATRNYYLSVRLEL